MNKHALSLTKRLALLGMLAALTAALSLLESWLPPLPVPLARLGLSNVTVTVAAWCLGPMGGIALGVFKVLLALLTRGATAFLMAACGTAASVAVTLLTLPLVRRETLTFVGVSVAAAGAHTLGQLVCATVLLTPSVWSYGVWLMAIGAVSGMVTGLVLNGLVGRLSTVWQKRFE